LKPIGSYHKEDISHLQTLHDEAVVVRGQVVVVHQVVVGVVVDMVMTVTIASSLVLTMVVRKIRLPVKSVEKLDSRYWTVGIGLMSHTHLTTTIPRELLLLQTIMELIQIGTPILPQQITLQGNWTS
jgi:hypothetical protein